MRRKAARHVLLTGPPGCGKTTVVISVLQFLRESGRPAFGFWTEEIRQAGVRQGFALELVSGRREVLASTQRPGSPRVGRYGVNVEVMNRVAVPEIERGIAAAGSASGVVLVMDEIGKMELFSKPFQQVVLSAFDSAAQVLATIMSRPHPLADALKARPDTELVTVRREEREGLARQIAEILGCTPSPA